MTGSKLNKKTKEEEEEKEKEEQEKKKNGKQFHAWFYMGRSVCSEVWKDGMKCERGHNVAEEEHEEEDAEE